jgi:16S rRNA (cytidine1402-2'-O)-methyltransferase
LYALEHCFSINTIMSESSVNFAEHAPNVLQAAKLFVQGQRFPESTLYVVATPIGNLADISLRALAVLDLCDIIAAEDTRVSHKLLQVYGISPNKIIRSDAYTESSISTHILSALAAGKRVALVSDAGTPAVSDPGAALVSAVREAGFTVVPLPGASSVVTLLSAAGLQDRLFSFLGFAPSQAKAREQFCRTLSQAAHTQVFFEAPHRAHALLAALGEQLAPEQRVIVGRELTKRFETIHSLKAGEIAAWLPTATHMDQGEFVIAVSGFVRDEQSTHSSSIASDTLLKKLLMHLPLKTAVALTSELTGGAKNEIYEKALVFKNDLTNDKND